MADMMAQALSRRRIGKQIMKVTGEASRPMGSALERRKWVFNYVQKGLAWWARYSSLAASATKVKPSTLMKFPARVRGWTS